MKTALIIILIIYHSIDLAANFSIWVTSKDKQTYQEDLINTLFSATMLFMFVWLVTLLLEA